MSATDNGKVEVLRHSKRKYFGNYLNNKTVVATCAIGMAHTLRFT